MRPNTNMPAYSHKHSIPQGNIRHVPTMPYRLAFAVTVSKAIDELENEIEGPLDGRKDVIAVAWPPAIEMIAKETAGKWIDCPQAPIPIPVLVGPKASAKLAFSLTPADGLMEATRIAWERGVALAFVDRDPAPGDVEMKSPCHPEPTLWADDWIAVKKGIATYLTLTRETAERYPWRSEPIASMRAEQMAANLQELSALHRRVIFVSFIADHAFVYRRLQEPAQLRDRDQDMEPPVAFQSGERLNVTNLVQVLDDFPRVSESYEMKRRQGKGGGFDKLSAVFERVARFTEEFGISRRRYDAFSRMLPGFCAEQGRLTPRMEQVLTIAESCFPRRALGPLRNSLLAYSTALTMANLSEIGPEKK
jgi:hypothetical protein